MLADCPACRTSPLPGGQNLANKSEYYIRSANYSDSGHPDMLSSSLATNIGILAGMDFSSFSEIYVQSYILERAAGTI